MKALIIVLVIIAAGVAAWAVWSSNNSTTVSPTPVATDILPESASPTASASVSVSPSVQPSKKVSVSINNFAFSSDSLLVHKGTKVTWTNNDSVTHTVTGDNGGPASPNITPGSSYSFIFNMIGTFPYHCSIHPQMTGVVQVIK